MTDAANRLTEDETFLYAYDANGNLETKTDKITSAVTTYSYDAENRLIQIDFPDLTTAAYRYDGLGRRIEKDVAGTITRYIYDREDIVLEYDGTNTLLARYTHGPGIDEPLVMERDLDASGAFEAAERFFYHADGLGSVTELTDSTGAVARAYAYDAYGQIVDEVGTLANPFTYTAREFDAESGLYFYRARYYDARTGAFTQQDPIGFAGLDVNLYRYVFNNPTNLTDPSGQFGIAGAFFGAISGGVGGYIAGGTSGAVIGAIAGAAVGAIIPTASSAAGAAAASAFTSVVGQAAAIVQNPNAVFSPSAVLGAGVAGYFGFPVVAAVTNLGKTIVGAGLGVDILGAFVEGAISGLGELLGPDFLGISPAFGEPAC